MKTKSSSKPALITSFTSLLLCFAMLIGTTFAWFTDSVTATTNQVQAGNLDVELQYSSNGEDWSYLSDGATNVSLFSTERWEPGHTEVVYLKVENKGTLAFNWKMLVYAAAETIGTNVAGDSFKLSEKLKYNLKAVDTVYASRDAALAAAGAGQALGSTNGMASAQKMAPESTSGMYALIVFMPTTVGNEANYKSGTAAPTINLGIRLQATQATVENDSFGNNYDGTANGDPDHPEFARKPETVVTQAAALETKVEETSAGEFVETVRTEAEVASSDITVTYPVGTVLVTDKTEAIEETTADATQGLVYTGTEAESSITLTSSNNTLGVYELTLPVATTNETLVSITKKIGANQDVVNVHHNNTKLTKITDPAEAVMTAEITGDKGYYLYDKTTGDLTLWVLHASEISVEYVGQYASGSGTANDPYIIKTPQQFMNIKSGSSSKTMYYKLGTSINLEKAVNEGKIAVQSVTNPVDYRYTVDTMLNYLSYAELDGNNYTITLPGDIYMVADMYRSTLKNATVKVKDAGIVYYAEYTNTFDNLKATGEFSVTTGNNGIFVTYGYNGTLTFNKCISKVNFAGTGDSTCYNAIFVGYPYGGWFPAYNYTFKNCENQGNFSSGKAAMFFGNTCQLGNSDILNLTIENCKNTGTMHATYVDSNYIPNWIAAFAYDYSSYKLNNDSAKTFANVESFLTDTTTVTNTGTVHNGPIDTGLALAQNEDGTFTVTPVSKEGVTVTKYVVSVGVYVGVPGGSNRDYVTEEIAADAESLTTTLKNYGFVDQAWVDANEEAVSGELCGRTTYTLGENTYYLVSDTVNFSTNGAARAPQMISVSAYNGSKLVASAQLQ